MILKHLTLLETRKYIHIDILQQLLNQYHSLIKMSLFEASQT